MTKQRFFENQINRKRVDSIGETVLITENGRMSNEDLFTVLLEGDTLDFLAQCNAIEAYGDSIKNEPPYVPLHSGICIVKMMKENYTDWYRAQYLQRLIDGRALVRLIDYGINQIVDENLFRSINKKMMFTSKTLLCVIKSTSDLLISEMIINKLTPPTKIKSISIEPIEGSIIHAIHFNLNSLH